MAGLPEQRAKRHRVLLVDDHTEVRSVLRLALERAGCYVVEADSGERAVHVVETSPVDLVVLDLGLPGLPGLDVLARIRARSDVSVIVLTARGAEADRVLGLELGADDYISKPFSPREVVARVNAVLRRSAGQPAAVLDFGDLVIDSTSREVRRDGELVRLTTKEFELLRFLAESPRQVFTKAQLLRAVWDSHPGWQTEATVSEHVHRLRKKIEVDPRSPRRLVTVHGAGYRFDP